MKIGIVGLGFMGSTHLKAIKQIPGVELVAVSSLEPKALNGDLSGIQGNLGGPGEKYDFSGIGRYADWRDLLRDENVEAVDFCTPTLIHTENAIEALKAGKHVLLEKPMALRGEDADTILEAASKSGKTLMVAQVLRFFPAYKALREAIVSGGAGKPRMVTFRRRCAAPFWSAWMTDPAKSGGALLDLLIHDVDFALHTFGSPESVSAVGAEDLPRGVDVITASLHYPDNLTVFIQGGWYHPQAFPFSMDYSVVCDEASFEFSSAGKDPTRYNADGTEAPLPVEDVDGYQAEIAYFVECASTGKSPDFCPPGESAAGIKLVDKLKEARLKNGERIA